MRPPSTAYWCLSVLGVCRKLSRTPGFPVAPGIAFSLELTVPDLSELRLPGCISSRGFSWKPEDGTFFMNVLSDGNVDFFCYGGGLSRTHAHRGPSVELKVQFSWVLKIEQATRKAFDTSPFGSPWLGQGPTESYVLLPRRTGVVSCPPGLEG